MAAGERSTTLRRWGSPRSEPNSAPWSVWIASTVSAGREGKGLANAIAGLFLTTEAVVAEKPEKEKAPAGMPDNGDMDF